MTLVSGPLSTVTADPTAVSVVQVSVQGPRTAGAGVQTHESKNVAVSGGVFSHEIAPGAATLTMIVGNQPGPPIPILVDDVESQTLADVVDAARLATGETQESLAQLVQHALAARTEVLDIVDDLVEEKDVALSAISGARGGALTDIDQATSSALVDIGTAESGALSAIGVEVGKAEGAADRAESAVNDGVGDGAVTVAKLAPDVKAQINSKADLVGGKVPTSQIPEVALTKPFSVASRAALLALDAQEGDIGIITAGADKGSYMLGSGPSNVFSSWVQLAVSADAPVQSVNGQTGTVVLNAADVGAAPTTHEHTMAQITDLPTVTQSNVADAIVQRQTNGNIQVPTSPSAGTDASSKAYVDQKILETGVVVEWADARKVTITAGTASAFTQGSETGSTSLISYWTSGTPAQAVFSVNVVCDKPTLNSSGAIVPAGSIIPAGIGFRPTSNGGIGPYTFTELGTTLGTLLENYFPLRSDTTVGTRIFAGDTMIYGDTGRRRVMPIRDSVTSGSLVVRRIGNTVTLFLDNLVPVDSSSPLQNLGLDIPAGFRPDESQVFGLVGNSGSALRSHKIAIFNKIIPYIQRDAGWNDTPIADGGYTGQISYSTTQSWPTSLPGTPA